MLGRSIPTDENDKPLEDGIYYNVPDHVYRDWDCFSYSMIKHIIKSPKHLRENHYNFKVTPAMDMGNIFETLLLEPDEVSKTCRYTPDKAEDAKGTMKPFSLKIPNHREIVQEIRDGGYIPIFPAQKSKADLMVESAKAHPSCSKYLLEGKTQVSLLWTCQTTGIRCKARLDVFNPHMNNVTDLKSSRSAYEEDWRKQMGNMFYHCQASHYLSGLSQLLTGEILSWTFFVTENEAPYCSAVYHLRVDSITTGAVIVQKAKEIYKSIQDLPEEEWPGYPTEEKDVDIKPYLLDGGFPEDEIGEGDGSF